MRRRAGVIFQIIAHQDRERELRVGKVGVFAGDAVEVFPRGGGLAGALVERGDDEAEAGVTGRAPQRLLGVVEREPVVACGDADVEEERQDLLGIFSGVHGGRQVLLRAVQIVGLGVGPTTREKNARIVRLAHRIGKGGQVVEVKVDAYPETTFKGVVDLIDARVAAESRSVLVRARFDNPDRRLLPGMFTNVTVVAGEPRDVTVVPRTAVSFSLYGDSVYVLTPKGETPTPGSAQAAPSIYTATRRFVRTGDVREGQTAILEGLKSGETVIAEGQIKLQNGASVVINPNAKLVPPSVRPKE